MNLLLLNAFIAMAPSTPPGTESTAPGWVQFLPLILMVVIFYFLLIRPQMKKQKAIDNLQKGIKTGDHIITSGGIYGTVTNVKDDILTVKIADNVKINIQRTAAGVVLNDKDAGQDTSSAGK